MNTENFAKKKVISDITKWLNEKPRSNEEIALKVYEYGATVADSTRKHYVGLLRQILNIVATPETKPRITQLLNRMENRQ